jgi:hypothetical protein
MIAKESHPGAIKTLRQKQSLRDHGEALGVACLLNPKFPDLIPPALGSVSARPWTFKLFYLTWKLMILKNMFDDSFDYYLYVV